jgi:hypothetical protein
MQGGQDTVQTTHVDQRKCKILFAVCGVSPSCINHVAFIGKPDAESLGLSCYATCSGTIWNSYFGQDGGLIGPWF